MNDLQAVADVFPLSTASQLAPTGAEEQQELGKRFGQRFLKTLFRGLGDNDVQFVTTSSPRAIDSATNFEFGFNQALGLDNMTRVSEKRDDLLRFFDECPRYVKEVDHNDSAVVEFLNFCTEIRPDVLTHMAKMLKSPKLNFSASKAAILILVNFICATP